MMVCDDGTECSRLLENSVLAFGFVDQTSNFKSSQYPRMNSSEINRVFDDVDIYGLGVKFSVFRFGSYTYAPWRGPGTCSLCKKTVDSIDGKIIEGRKGWCGVVLIPSRSIMRQYYLFPGLLGHLIEVHGYVPPDDLVQALLDFEFDPKWNTKELEHKLFSLPIMSHL